MKKRIDEHTRVRECRMFLQGEVATSGLWKEILPPENPSITIPTNWEICVMQERFQYLLYIKAPVSELVKLPPIQLEYSAKKIVLSVDFSTGIVEMKDDIQKSILKIFQVSVELP